MKDTIDLMPREVTQQRNVRSRMATWLLLGGALLVAVVFSAVSMALRAGSVAAAVAPLREQITTLRQAREQVKPLSEQLRTSLDKQALAARLLQEPAWYAFFSDIAAAVHSRVWVSSIMAEQLLDTELSTPSEGPTVSIGGSAGSDFDLLQFMNALATSPRLTSLVLQQSQHTRGEAEGEQDRVDFVLQGVLATGGRE